MEIIDHPRWFTALAQLIVAHRRYISDFGGSCDADDCNCVSNTITDAMDDAVEVAEMVGLSPQVISLVRSSGGLHSFPEFSLDELVLIGQGYTAPLLRYLSEEDARAFLSQVPGVNHESYLRKIADAFAEEESRLIAERERRAEEARAKSRRRAPESSGASFLRPEVRQHGELSDPPKDTGPYFLGI